MPAARAGLPRFPRGRRVDRQALGRRDPLDAVAGSALYFAEIAQAVPGLSDRLLSRRLRELEEVGLVERSVHEGTPPRVSYELTAEGAELEPAIRELGDWAKRWNLS